MLTILIKVIRSVEKNRGSIIVFQLSSHTVQLNLNLTEHACSMGLT